MDNTAAQKLRFRIVECTGEDPQHPVAELLTSSPQSNGWQSQRFCGFPQYITFQFLTPVMLKQIQFLSHENKIATKLELFTAMTDSKHPLPSTDLKFRKLGFLTLDSNEGSNFQLRELKTVYVEAPCFYLRVALHKCHINKYNFFNQVGLIALAVYGEPIIVSPPKPVNQPEKKERAEPITPMDEITLRKIKELEEAKQKAVESEAFDDAHRMKADIAKLKSLGLQIQKLEDKKVAALENDDYSGADGYKKEIDKVKEAVLQIGIKLRSHPRHPSEKIFNTQESYEQASQKESFLELSDKPLVKNRLSAKEGRPKNNSQQRNDTDENEEAKIDRDYDDYGLDGHESHKQGNRVAYDEQVIPALKKKNPNIIEEQPSETNLVQEAEQLSSQHQRLAEPIAPVVGAEICKKIFSKHWNLREEALQTLIAELPKGDKSQVINYTDDVLVFVSLTAIVSYTIGDRLPQISSTAMTLLKTLMTKKQSNITKTAELSTSIDNITNALIEKLGDNNVRLRDQAEEVLLVMARNPLVSCSYCVNALVKGGPTGKFKGGQTPKHIVSRLKALQSVIKEFKINNHDVPYHPVLEYATDKFEHPSSDVRTNVVSLLVDIYNLVGDKLKTDLEGMKLAHIEMLQKEFEAAKGAGNPQTKGTEAKGKTSSPAKNSGKEAEGKPTNDKLNGKSEGKTPIAPISSDVKNKVKNETVDGRGSAGGKLG